MGKAEGQTGVWRRGTQVEKAERKKWRPSKKRKKAAHPDPDKVEKNRWPRWPGGLSGSQAF